MEPRTTVLPARLDALRQLRDFAEAFCDESGLSRDFFNRLNLVVEELFTNTVHHGHGKDCDAPVWVALSRCGSTVWIGMEDTAPAYNPFERPVPPEPPAESRRIGGYGVQLTRAMTSSAEYAYVFGRNRLRLSMQVGPNNDALRGDSAP